MNKNAVIIGAGLAGLSAGIRLQQTGINSRIFEQAQNPGGVCVAWERGGYRFDGCIEWMVGTKPDSDFNKLFKKVDALTPETEIYNAPFIRMEIAGEIYDVPMNIGGFRRLLLSISPEDKEFITGFCDDIEKLTKFDMPAGAPSNAAEMLKIVSKSGSFAFIMMKYGKKTVEETASVVKSHILRQMLYNLMCPEFSAGALVMMLSQRFVDNAGYPIGGSTAVIRRMEKKYLELGGHIDYRTMVDKVIVDSGKAVGVNAGGKIYAADTVIAASDMHDLLSRLLENEYHHKTIESLLDEGDWFPPLFTVSLGLNRRFGLPYTYNLQFPQKIELHPGVGVDSIQLRSFEFDPTSAPEGCSSIMAEFYGGNYEYWQNLRDNDIEAYRAAKERVSQDIIAALDRRFPGLADAVKVIDVATPATYTHYDVLYKGSWEGYAPTPSAMMKQVKPVIKGVKGLYLSGQWTTPGGGTCTAVRSGLDAAEQAIKQIDPSAVKSL